MTLSSGQIIAIERRMKGVRYQIDSRDRNTIASALRVASEQYRRDASANAGSSLAAQFILQADECEVLAELIEP